MAALDDAWPGAVAVSGGGDSVALMLLLRDWADGAGLAPPVVLTVDHGLREGSAADAKRTARWARDAGLSARILTWPGEKPRADLEAHARAARYRLMGEWCRAHRIASLFVAHTLEDQAETFLLRLGRGSGLDGLSAMRVRAPLPVSDLGDIGIYRPMLGFSRPELRAWLTARGQPWIEDPMNADPRFARTRVRNILPQLKQAGISARRIADAAGHLARARAALEQQTANFLLMSSRSTTQGVQFDRAALAALPPELGLRALARMLSDVSGAPYRPRFQRLCALFQAIVTGRLGGGRTLLGCRIAPPPRRKAQLGANTLLIAPESKKTKAPAAS